jgi:hypothetical protein
MEDFEQRRRHFLRIPISSRLFKAFGKDLIPLIHCDDPCKPGDSFIQWLVVVHEPQTNLFRRIGSFRSHDELYKHWLKRLSMAKNLDYSMEKYDRIVLIQCRLARFASLFQQAKSSSRKLSRAPRFPLLKRSGVLKQEGPAGTTTCSALTTVQPSECITRTHDAGFETRPRGRIPQPEVLTHILELNHFQTTLMPQPTCEDPLVTNQSRGRGCLVYTSCMHALQPHERSKVYIRFATLLWPSTTGLCTKTTVHATNFVFPSASANLV